MLKISYNYHMEWQQLHSLDEKNCLVLDSAHAWGWA